MTDIPLDPPSRPQTALVLGASGGIGGAVAEALLARGWQVRGLARDPVQAQARWPAQAGAIEWRTGDALRRQDVLDAAAGVQLIVHAVNPPGYQQWDRLVLPMIDNTIAAARASGARILLPGTLYNFDPAVTPVVHEGSAQRPRAAKGRIRVELERRLQAAAPEVRTLVVRAGDYFGPRVRSSWFAQALVTQGRPLRRLMHPAPRTGHAWAYLPDLAQAMVRLAEHPDLRAFERVGFEGLWDPDGRGLPALLARVAGRERLPQWPFPWWALRLAAPFSGFAREAAEIAPYWRHPMRIDNARLVQLLGAEPRTPVLQALRHTLQGLGCLPPGAAAAAPVDQPARTVG
ncbi:MAG TPA: NAD(P)H-binding protein [Roseateles sp.]